MHYRPFDILNTPLKGVNVIEAGAGTGKTYNLVGLFLRLLLEKDVPLDRILVVTFTRAATEELKDRLRSRLRQALDVFLSGASPDPLLQSLLERAGKRGAGRLEEALRHFDEAAVFTIHGFCERALRENAFESGSPFDTELVTEVDDFWQELAEDFWRLHLYTAPLELVAHAGLRRLSPATFRSLLLYAARYPGIRVVPQVSDPPRLSVEALRSSYRQIRQAWPGARSGVEKVFMDPGLKANVYGSLSGQVSARALKAAAWLESMDRYAGSGGPGYPLFEGADKFTAAKLSTSTKKGAAPPAHPFCDLFEIHAQNAARLEKECDRYFLYLENALFDFARKEAPARKAAANVQFFEDLILNLHGALQGRKGETLLRTLRRKYRAALIDEFQDTDPVQYSIFRTLFSGPEQVLFLIGDPKQAIYGFRGADIFAYMEAAARASAIHGLTENWRSSPGLIQAVNTLFTRPAHPFVFEAIAYHPAASARGTPDPPLSGPCPEAPLQIWLLPPPHRGDQKPLPVEEARGLAAQAVAGHIGKLMEMARAGKECLEGRPLRSGDVAVIVRTNDEARRVQQSLRIMGISAVLHSTGSLFDTLEAEEMYRIASAVAEPGALTSLAAALSTNILGRTAETLRGLLRDEAATESLFGLFRQYHTLWMQEGFLQMFRRMLGEQEVRQRLLGLVDGERRLTNALHLAEVLHRQERDRHLGMAGLLAWFARQLDPESPRLEEHQLRLESDAEAVQLVTVHRSKGLEYPVVYCPFLWHGSKVGKAPFTFHDPSEGLRMTLDVGSEEELYKRHAERELLAENLRLLYVALTRAQHRCHMVWGPVKGAETSALAYLLQGTGPEHEEGDAGAHTRHTQATEGQEMPEELADCERRGQGSIRVTALPRLEALPERTPEQRGKDLACRTFSGAIDSAWSVTSFSALAAPSMVSAGERPWDETAPRAEALQGVKETAQNAAGQDTAALTLFDFPAGVQAGTMLHALLETLDFTTTEYPALMDHAQATLSAHGFDLKWARVLCHMVANLVQTPLDPSVPGLTLSKIPMHDRLNEMEFTFPLSRVSAGAVQRILEEDAGKSMGRQIRNHMGALRFSTVKGFMNGFIDLVFRYNGAYYLVDWKSNHLGNRVEDYAEAVLAVEMARDLYVLQYHIYVTALHLYLKQRVRGYRYERHFGGVYYVFLRGVDTAHGSGYGIYRDRPDPNTIRKLCACLLP